MSKKIVILNGSPRLKGNTSTLCDEFAKGAESAGHKNFRFDLKKLDIHDCIGCLRGGEDKGAPRVQKDDMDQIYAAYREADALVLASPIYWENFSGLLKRAFDRLYAFYEYEQKHAGGQYKPVRKESVLLMCAGGDTPGNWKPAIDYYDALTKLLNWEDRGKVLVGGVINVGDIKENPKLGDARELGASL